MTRVRIPSVRPVPKAPAPAPHHVSDHHHPAERGAAPTSAAVNTSTGAARAAAPPLPGFRLGLRYVEPIGAPSKIETATPPRPGSRLVRFSFDPPRPATHRAVGEHTGRARAPEPSTPSTALPYRDEMERAFGTSFAGVATHLGERDALSPFGARAAAWPETVASASSTPERDVVAHELAHIEQLRRAGDAVPSAAVGTEHPAEREAAQIAAAVRAGATRVRATAIPGGAVAFDRGPAAPATTHASAAANLIAELGGHVAALESVLLTEEGRARTVQIVEQLLAQIDASRVVLSPAHQALVDRARSLVAPARPELDPALIPQTRDTLVALLASVDAQLRRTVGFLPQLNAEFTSVTWSIPWRPQPQPWSRPPMDFIQDQVRWMARALASARSLFDLSTEAESDVSLAMLRMAGVRVSATMLALSELRPFLYYLQTAIAIRLDAPLIDPVPLAQPVDHARARIAPDLAAFALLEDRSLQAIAVSSAATTQALFREIPVYAQRLGPAIVLPELPWQAEALVILALALLEIPGAPGMRPGGFTLAIRGGLMPALSGGGAAVAAITLSAEQIAALRRLIAIGAIGTAVVSAALGTSLAVGVELPPELADLIGEGPEATAMHETGKTGAGMARKPRHHVMPQEERAWFKERGMTGGRDIDQFTVEMEQAEHEALHGGGRWRLGRMWPGEWNRHVMNELRKAERIAGRKLRPNDILDIVAREMRRYDISMDFVPYRAP